MSDDRPGSTSDRPGVARAAVFLVAALACAAVAIGLRSVESASGRVFPLLFTSVCLSVGAATCFVLSVVELVGARRVGQVGVERSAASLR